MIPHLLDLIILGVIVGAPKLERWMGYRFKLSTRWAPLPLLLLLAAPLGAQEMDHIGPYPINEPVSWAIGILGSVWLVYGLAMWWLSDKKSAATERANASTECGADDWYNDQWRAEP